MLSKYLNTKHPPGNARQGLLRSLIVVMLIFATYFIPSAAYSQPNITRIEYYIDTDPGFGSATAVSFTASTDIQNKVIPINPASVSVGVHRMYVRARDANGSWSLTNTLLFYKPYGSGTVPPPPPAPTNITRVEYYIDNDPGFGNATPVSITASTDIQNAIIPINPATLAVGVHRFYVRARNANGNWSLTNTWLFYKPYGSGTVPPAPVLAKMSKLEYYIDNDPGYGNGVPVALDSLTNFADYVVPVNVTGLATGSHSFWVRGLDKNGNWSLVNNWLFSISSVLATPSIVVNSITDSTNCAADSFYISYHKTGTYNAGNVFNVQLSDAAGSFTSPTTIGSYTGTVSTIIKAKLPAHIPDGANYKVRVSSTNPVVTGVATSTTITIHDRPTAQTITGNSNPNMGSSFPYSVPSFAGSVWTWIVPAATITQTANSANLVFNVLGPQTIKIIETNQFGCIGDTSTKDVIVMGVLPVTYVSFTVTAENDKVILQWTTATEINSKDFQVQRSLDGVNFATIATISAAGNSNQLRSYVYDDLQSASLKGKVVFFRIIERDVDGKLLYTSIKNVKIPDGKNRFTLVYNPVQNEALLKYDCAEKDKVQIRVVDHLGRVIFIIEQSVQPGVNEIKLQTGNLAKGIYEVELTGNNGHENVRMMKQ